MGENDLIPPGKARAGASEECSCWFLVLPKSHEGDAADLAWVSARAVGYIMGEEQQAWGIRWFYSKWKQALSVSGKTSPHPSRPFAVMQKQCREMARQRAVRVFQPWHARKQCAKALTARGGLPLPTRLPLAHHILSQI